MSVPMDLNFMDFLLTKADTNLDDKYFTLKQEHDGNSSSLMEDDIAWAGADDFLDGIFSLEGVDPALDILDLPTVDPPSSSSSNGHLSMPALETQSVLEFLDQKSDLADHVSATASSDGATSDSGLCSDVDVIESQASPELMLLDEEEEISPAYSPAVSSPGPSISEVGVVFSPEHSSSVITSSSSADSDDMGSSVIETIPEKKMKLSNNNKYTLQSNTAGRIITVQTQKPHQYGRKNLNVSKSSVPHVYSNNASTNNQNNIRKVIRLSTVNTGNNSNPRSILLPVTIKDMKDLRTIKIINATGLKKTSAGIKLAAANLLQQGKQGLLKSNVVLTQQQLGLDDSFSDKGCNSDDSVFYEDCNEEDTDASYPRLVLTPEEQRLLVKEGITLPSNYPLTKHEERELKRIRRKIRNKISAQDSRKRKKEYVDGLEDRVKQCTEENQTLMKRIKVLQNQNQSLATQLRKLHSMLSKGTNKTTQPATCLMVLLLSMALIAVPSLRPGGTSVATQQELAAQQQAEQQTNQDLMASTRRSLLYTKNQGYMEEPIDDDINMDDLLTFHSDHDYPIVMKRSVKKETISNIQRKRALLDLPVDDTWPPPKMKKYDKEYGLGDDISYEENDIKSEIEYDYYYTDDALEPDEGIHIYEPLDVISELEVPGPVYTVGGKIGELLDVAGQVSLNKQIVNDMENIANDAKNKSEINGKSTKIVMQVTEQ